MNIEEIKKEIWIPIKCYEGLYEVSNMGRFKSKHYKKDRILKSAIAPEGYHKVALCNKMKQKTFLVHRLVAENFLGLKGVGLKGKELLVNHKDQNKLNNRLDNLEWVSQTENMRQAKENINNINLYNTKRVKCIGKENIIFDSITIASKYFNTKYYNIINCLNGRSKTACNHKWEYAEKKYNLGGE